MQVTETSADGLKREIQIVLPVTDLNARCEKRLDDIKDDVQLRGFRKGKVPKVHLKKVFGRRLMLEVLQEAVEESSKQALTDRNERPVAQPDIAFPEDQSEIEDVVSGSKDFSYSMTYEVIPPIDLVDFESLEVERLVAEVGEADLDTALTDLAKRNTVYEPKEEGVAEDGDKVKVDFVGKIDGEAFDGGTASDIDVVIGQGGFIPGFEDGLKNVASGAQTTITTAFPEDYPVDTLQGKEAVFDVTVKEIASPKEAEVNDELATALGIENLEKLKELVSSQIKSEYDQISRAKLKRSLLDVLDEKHSFELPPSLVNAEFEGIWNQLLEQMKREEKEFDDGEHSEEKMRAEYQKVAERRVRLGLILGEIGEKFEVKVEQDELREALVQQARQFPGQEQHVYEYFEKTPGAIGQLRGPIFEDKVVDLVVDKAKVSERTVTREELVEPMDDDTVGAEAEAASAEKE